MTDCILKIPKQVAFGVNCDATKLCLRNNPTWNKEDIEDIEIFI